jgi:hypothetical protein
MESGFPIETIDIAHPPLTAQQAEEALDEILRNMRSDPRKRVLKIIHGKGSNERPAVLKEVTLNWAYRRRKSLRAVIPGSAYDCFHADTLAMRKECGQTGDADLGAGNEGMTIIWVK